MVLAGSACSRSTVLLGKRKRRRISLMAGVCVSLVLMAVFGVLLNVPSVGGSGEIGVRASDWIVYTYSYGIAPVTVHTEWVRVDFLNIDGNNVTMRGTLHLSNGTEPNETFTEDISGNWSNASWDGPIFDTLSGFLIPANSTVPTDNTDPKGWASIGGAMRNVDNGDATYEINTSLEPCALIRDSGDVMISPLDYEVQRSYLGTLRTVVKAGFSNVFIENGPVTCFYDKQTGVLVETECLGYSRTGADGWDAIATDSSLWQSDSEAAGSAVLYILAIAATAVAVVIVFSMIRRRTRPPEVESSESFEEDRG